MTIERLTVLTCNACDEEHVPGPTAKAVRKYARDNGWRLNDQGEDYCPHCRWHYASDAVIEPETSEDSAP